MTKDEALKLALDWLEEGNFVYPTSLRTAIKEALAQPEQEPVDCYGYAARLATSIWKQHYQKTAPQWQVLDNLMGVLTQIDNMAAGLISTPLPEQPEQEPVAWRIRCTNPMRDWVLMYHHPKTQEQFSNMEIQPLYTTPPLPVQEPIARVIDNGTPEGATEWIPFTNRIEPLKTGDLLYTHAEERNFCPRCGKRTADPTMIHTCTPPIAADS